MPSGFQDSQWPFVKWDWDSVHLAREVHEDRNSLEGFQRWLSRKVTGLGKDPSSNKNALQALLLGVGLFLRDHELACFEDAKATPIPKYLANSCMTASDVDPITREIRLIHDFIEFDLEYVFLQEMD